MKEKVCANELDLNAFAAVNGFFKQICGQNGKFKKKGNFRDS